ncbi:hypothetical protein H5S09_02880 [Limosilactobacillus sp. STM2_1]|uniref:Uncharacterized protein n=1 Tax=Limosilactobacillus rudii TaxID=2759755 RepID=A0A7W3UKV1_9LACO|nr:hypothetical protein [Limosilactobacillus rudii]MBB1080201.1 hypothetical protein [Limosilactobacillus rudii]MBB1096895.1 hypothetical protein [Limosilactobacillus rudii]MCD7133793.1 hypothetical protein [Limosilactobacillus rudii]
MTTIAAYYGYEEALAARKRIANSIPPEAYDAMRQAAELNQRISEILAPAQEQLSQLQELITLASKTDIKIASALNRINNEITDHPVESFVKFADAVDNFPESNFDYPDHESRKLSDGNEQRDYSAKNSSTSDNVKIFIKKQMDQFKNENSILKPEKPDIEKCFIFFKLLFHSICVLFVVLGTYDQTLAIAYIEVVIAVIDDILAFKNK